MSPAYVFKELKGLRDLLDEIRKAKDIERYSTVIFHLLWQTKDASWRLLYKISHETTRSKAFLPLYVKIHKVLLTYAWNCFKLAVRNSSNTYGKNVSNCWFGRAKKGLIFILGDEYQTQSSGGLKVSLNYKLFRPICDQRQIRQR